MAGDYRVVKLLRTVSLVVAMVIVSAVGLAGCARDSSNSAGVTIVGGEQPGPWKGVELDPPTARPAIMLTDVDGSPFDFRARTAGKITLLYFGYTHCPDVCPLLMSYIAQALKDLPAKVADKVDVVFVTVDPARDTGPVLRGWLNNIDPAFIGLTGSIEQIVAAEKAAGVPTSSMDSSEPNGYTVLHSAEVLAFGFDDQAHVLFDSASTPTDFEHDLRLLAKGVT